MLFPGLRAQRALVAVVVYNVGVIELRAQILPEGGQIFLPQPVALDGFFFGEPLGFRLVGKFVDALHAGFFHSKTLLKRL